MFLVIIGLVAIAAVGILIEKASANTVNECCTSNSSPDVTSISGINTSIPQADGNSFSLPCGYTMTDSKPKISSRLNSTEITRVALNAGFDDSNVLQAVAIALAESSGNPNAVGDKSLAPRNGPSYGLWQINVGDKAHPELKNVNLFDPQTNANEAFKLYKRRGNFNDWSTFTNEAYLAHLDNAQQGYDAINA